MTIHDQLPTTELPHDADADQIERHLEQTRHQMGETVEALSRKLDVRSRVREATTRAGDQVRQIAARIASSVRERKAMVVAGGAAATAAGVAGLVAWKRTH